MKLSENSPPGMFVCMSKSIFNVPDDYTYSWSESGVTVLAIPGSIELSPRFGVFVHDPNNTEVLKYYQHYQPEEILKQKAYYKNDKQVLIDTGVIFFDISTTTKLFELHSNPPLDACTLSGIDEGAEPLCLNLFGDYLMALGGNDKEVISDEEYYKRQTTDPKYILLLYFNYYHSLSFSFFISPYYYYIIIIIYLFIAHYFLTLLLFIE